MRERFFFKSSMDLRKAHNYLQKEMSQHIFFFPLLTLTFTSDSSLSQAWIFFFFFFERGKVNIYLLKTKVHLLLEMEFSHL